MTRSETVTEALLVYLLTYSKSETMNIVLHGCETRHIKNSCSDISVLTSAHFVVVEADVEVAELGLVPGVALVVCG